MKVSWEELTDERIPRTEVCFIIETREELIELYHRMNIPVWELQYDSKTPFMGEVSTTVDLLNTLDDIAKQYGVEVWIGK